MDDCALPTVVLDEYLPDWHVPDDAGIIITHMHYRWEEISTLRKIHSQNKIPVLLLCDGILEYRNTWEHPDLADGSIFQPACGHKIACIGRGQARTIESWGNVGKCEVVGLPRLDSLLDKPITTRKASSTFKLLIATANTPAFDEQQRATVLKSLQLIWSRLESGLKAGGRDVEAVWRLSDGLDEDLGIDVADPENLPPILNVIDEVDAVITTPSTMYLESILRKRPTALLDFHNCPRYVPSAWVIGADEHFEPVINELADPPIHKLLYQASTLVDQLECNTPAKPRMLVLTDAMITAGQTARQSRTPLELPHRILTNPSEGFTHVPQEFDLAQLYQNNKIFQNQDLQRLQIELAAAINRLDQLPTELAEKNRFIAQLVRTADHSRMRIEDMHNRIVAIRKRFGVEPSYPEVDGRDVGGKEEEQGS